MHALLVDETGGPAALQYRETDDPTPKKGEVVIDVKAAGVNFPDLLMTQGLYQFKPTPPFSPGGEVAGVVSAVGPGVSRLAVGDEVIGLGMWGGFAEKMALGQENVLHKPKDVSFEVASAITMTYGTCLHAYKDRARLAAGETVLVLGAGGGVGTAAVELGKLMGAKVIAAASSAEKLEACVELGADATIDYVKEDLKARAKALGGGGVDVIVDPVGGDYAEPALRAMGWNGRYLVIGFAAGEIPKVPLNLTLLKGCAIVGVFWGSFLAREPVRATEQLARLGRWVAEGKLRPKISKVYPLAKGRTALEALARREVVGKVVLSPGAS